MLNINDFDLILRIHIEFVISVSIFIGNLYKYPFGKTEFEPQVKYLEIAKLP